MKSMIACLIAIVSLDAWAGQDLTCSENGAVVLFTNGVLTKRHEADTSIRAIRELHMDSEIDEKAKVKYELIYNRHEGILNDFTESLIQFIDQSKNSRDASAESLSSFLLGVDDPPEPIRAEIVANFKAAILRQEEVNTDELVNEYFWNLSQDKKILAISHSQGGFFVNRAYSAWSSNLEDWQKNTFATVQVATPVSSIIPQGVHRTYREDIIQLIPGSLWSNIGLTLHLPTAHGDHWFLEEFMHHGMLETYFRLEATRQALRQGIREAAQMLGPNCKGCYRGIAFERGNYHRNLDDSTAGFISLDAEVADTVYVTGEPEVCGRAKVHGSVVLMDQARIEDDAEIFDNTVIFGKARVFGKAKVFGTSLIQETAQIGGSTRFYGILGPRPIASFPEVHGAGLSRISPVIIGNSDIKDAVLYGDISANGAGLVMDYVEAGGVSSNISITGSPTIQRSMIAGPLSISGSPEIKNSYVAKASISDQAFVLGSLVSPVGWASISGSSQLIGSIIAQGSWAFESESISNMACGEHINPQNVHYVACLPFDHPDNFYFDQRSIVLPFPIIPTLP